MAVDGQPVGTPGELRGSLTTPSARRYGHADRRARRPTVDLRCRSGNAQHPRERRQAHGVSSSRSARESTGLGGALQRDHRDDPLRAGFVVGNTGIASFCFANMRSRSSPSRGVALARYFSVPTSTVTTACLRRFQYQSGCLSDPAHEPKIRSRSPSARMPAARCAQSHSWPRWW